MVPFLFFRSHFVVHQAAQPISQISSLRHHSSSSIILQTTMVSSTSFFLLFMSPLMAAGELRGSDSQLGLRINEFKLLDGHQTPDDFHSPLPHEYIDKRDLPKRWDWRNVTVNGSSRSFLTHVSRYCHIIGEISSMNLIVTNQCCVLFIFISLKSR